MKQCTKCLEHKSFLSFYRQANNNRDGLQSHCKMCDNKRVAKRKALNLERTKNIQAISDRNRYEKSKLVILARNKTWKKDNPNKMQAVDAKRRASQLKRTPSWLTEDDFWMMEQAYELAQLRSQLFGFSWHVDHILPLQGKLVSGLHVPHNLQVLPAIENLRKRNNFLPA